jgi:hypothetical protein
MITARLDRASLVKRLAKRAGPAAYISEKMIDAVLEKSTSC